MNAMKQMKCITALLCVVAVLSFGGCKATDETENFYGFIFPFNVYDDIVIEDGFLYSGEFPEDGSFEEKENVFALKVSNNSEKNLRLIRFYVTTSKKEMFFELTTLTAKSNATVFEKSGQGLEKDEEIIDIKAENIVFFENDISLKEDKIEISPRDLVLNIKNISDKDISSDVYVYYKRVDENGDYFGGITFRSKAEGLKADELKQIPASDFHMEKSKVIFVDYLE